MQRMSMKLRLTALAALAALAAALAGCSAHGIPSTLPAPGGPAGVPTVLQNSSQWLDLVPLGSGTSLNDIVAGSDGAMWAFGGFSQGARYTMAEKLKTFTLNVTGPNGPGSLFSEGHAVRAGTNLYANGFDGDFGGAAIFGVITPQRVVNIYSIPSGDAPNGSLAYDPVNQSVWFGALSHIDKVDVATNAVTEFPINDDDVYAVAYGPDGNIWTVQLHGTTQVDIIVYNPADASIVATYPFSCILGSLVAGSDGNLYGAAGGQCGNFLAKITTAGAITRIPLPVRESLQPTGIALIGVGAESGHIVVSENAGDNFADYDPTTGVVTQIAAPPQYAGDYGIAVAAGPDGNIWQATSSGNVLVDIVDIITANPTSITVNVGAIAPLSATEPDKAPLSAKSSKTSVATVTKSHGSFTVTGVSAGTCTITIKDKIGNSLRVPVTVQ